MSGTIFLEERIEIPMGLASLAEFRAWALSDDFPESGRIDFIGGRIEVDMSPEDLFTHGTLKGKIYSVLLTLVDAARLGHLFTDSTRLSSVSGDLSCEPDIVFVSWQSLESGRVRLVPKAGRESGRYVELEGAPDLVVEIVSDRSVGKDNRRLPPAYFAAGIDEYWLVDARPAELLFRIHTRGRDGFTPVEPDADGLQPSTVFGRKLRLLRHTGPMNLWQYDLVIEPSSQDA
jgi:Uma2 family endonuclease